MKNAYALKPVLKNLGVEKLRQHQIEPIRQIRAGGDAIFIAPTSAGKSLIAQVPAVEKEDRLTIFVEPTLSLMHDQVRKLRDRGIRAAYIDASQSEEEVGEVLKRTAENKLNILYITPERLASSAFLYAIQQSRIFMVVVDECHCVLEWGYSFRPAYLRIGEFIDSLPSRPIVAAMSATASPEECDKIAALLHMKEEKVFRSSLDRTNLSFLWRQIGDGEEVFEEKLRIMKSYIRKAREKGSVVVYCLTRDETVEVYNALRERWGDDVTYCHGGMKPNKRSKNELAFLSDNCGIMVATSAFGMGVDKANIRLIVHFHTPLSMGEYYQQAGRAGRDGEKAKCLLLSSKEDEWTGKAILKGIGSEKGRKAAQKRHKEMLELVQGERCIVHGLLASFGEQSGKSCKRCSHCQRKRGAKR